MLFRAACRGLWRCHGSPLDGVSLDLDRSAKVAQGEHTDGLVGYIAKRNEHNRSGSSTHSSPLIRQTAVRDFRTAMDVGWQSECKPQTRLSIGRIRILQMEER